MAQGRQRGRGCINWDAQNQNIRSLPESLGLALGDRDRDEERCARACSLEGFRASRGLGSGPGLPEPERLSDIVTAGCVHILSHRSSCPNLTKETRMGSFSVQSLFIAKYIVCGHFC